MEISEVFWDRYRPYIERQEEIIDIYAEGYHVLKKPTDRISFTCNLGSLERDIDQKLKRVDNQIEEELQELKAQIYALFDVEYKPIQSEDMMFLRPLIESFEDTLEGIVKYFDSLLDYFVFCTKHGFSGFEERLAFLEQEYEAIKEKGEVKPGVSPPNFSCLQRILIHSEYYLMLHGHWNAIVKVSEEIIRKNYPEKLSLLSVHEEAKSLPRSKIETIIGDLAKNISRKRSSNYSSQTIELYLKEYTFRPDLTKNEILDACISKTDDESIKLEFIEKCAPSTLTRWEERLKTSVQDIQQFDSMRTAFLN